jgi:hypothetical protein
MNGGEYEATCRKNEVKRAVGTSGDGLRPVAAAVVDVKKVVS